MSNSASVSFYNSRYDSSCNESITLFEHWGGRELHQRAKAFAAEVAALPDDGTPLGRLEPSIVMANFIYREMKRAVEEDESVAGGPMPGHLIRSSFYPERSRNDGDNHNCGHRKIKLGRTQ